MTKKSNPCKYGFREVLELYRSKSLKEIKADLVNHFIIATSFVIDGCREHIGQEFLTVTLGIFFLNFSKLKDDTYIGYAICPK